jgi:hypothetical protein
MSAIKRVLLISSFASAPLVIAAAIWLVPAVIEAFQNQKYLSGFEKINEAKTPLTIAQVEEAMGRPAHIDESESADQTITGMVYHYPAHGEDMKVVFVHGVVLRTEFTPTAKS